MVIFLNKPERGHELAYLIWDTNTIEDLDHLQDVFLSCYIVRKEQFGVIDRFKKEDDIKVGYVFIDDKIVDLRER